MAVKLTNHQSIPAASTNVVVALIIGVVVGGAAGLILSWKFSPLLAWDAAALAYIIPTWLRILKFDGELVKKHALREDPSRVASDLILLVASLASLAGVGALLFGSDTASDSALVGQSLLGVMSVVVSWVMGHRKVASNSRIQKHPIIVILPTWHLRSA